jgi:hypothetical protein
MRVTAGGCQSRTLPERETEGTTVRWCPIHYYQTGY